MKLSKKKKVVKAWAILNIPDGKIWGWKGHYDIFSKKHHATSEAFGIEYEKTADTKIVKITITYHA